MYFWGVAKSSVGHRGWPITAEDIQSANYGDDGVLNPHFTSCADPFIPRIVNLSIDKEGPTPTIRWQFQAGCAVGLSDIQFVISGYNEGIISETVDPETSPSPCLTEGTRTSCSYVLRRSSDGFGYVIVQLEPQHREYGAFIYPSYLVGLIND